MKNLGKIGAIVLVMVLFGGSGIVLAGDLGSSVSYNRFSGNGNLSGQLLVRNVSGGIWTQGSNAPVPGNIGTWDLWVNISGDFLGSARVTQDDVNYALANPWRMNWGRSDNRLIVGDDVISFYQTFSANGWLTSQLSNSGGKGIAANTTAGTTADLWNWTSISVDVVGGSITQASFYPNTIKVSGSPADSYNDWSASFDFSGIISSTDFSVMSIAVPEPGTLITGAILGTALFFRRRRLVA